MTTNGRANGATERPGRAKIAADLRARLKHSQVIEEPAELQTYSYDASFLTQLNPIPPDVAVIARSTEDVVAVMRYADEQRHPRHAARRGQRPDGGVGGRRRRHRAGDERPEPRPRNRPAQHAGDLRAGRRPRQAQRAARAAPADLPARSRLEPDGDGRRDGLHERPRHARRQVRPDQRLGARPRSRAAERRGHRDRLGRVTREAVVGRAGADQADRRRRRRPRASSRGCASS